MKRLHRLPAWVGSGPQIRSTSAAYYADGRDKSSFDVPGKLKMKFSAMSPAGAYAPTTHAPPGGNFRFRSFSLFCLCSQFEKDGETLGRVPQMNVGSMA